MAGRQGFMPRAVSGASRSKPGTGPTATSKQRDRVAGCSGRFPQLAHPCGVIAGEVTMSPAAPSSKFAGIAASLVR